MQILADHDAAEDGEKGALLRREGLYTSDIAVWRRARDAGALAGLTAPRGRPRSDSAAEQIARLQAEKKQLELELAKARFVVDVHARDLRARAPGAGIPDRDRAAHQEGQREADLRLRRSTP